jgi:hypothetical protein
VVASGTPVLGTRRWALPEIVTQLRSSPEDLTATFKLYRNLDALYDVLGNITESAGAFGSKDEFQSLSNDLNAMERNRRSLGERLETLSASKESELAQLRTQIKALQAAPPPPPKKIVVDDNEPKKPAAKKKVPRPPKPTTAQPSTPPGAILSCQSTTDLHYGADFQRARAPASHHKSLKTGCLQSWNS